MTDVDPSRPDGLLQVLVSVANTTGVSMGVTVTVPGAVVSGLLVGHQIWVEKLTEAMTAAGETGEAMGRAFRENLLLEPEPDEAGEDEKPLPLFVHLTEAHIMSGDSMHGPVLWRGRLSDVSGWSLGNFRRT